MIKLLLLAVVPFMTQHRNVVPKTEVSTNFYGSVTGIVDKAYVEGLGIEPVDTQAVIKAANDYTDSATGAIRRVDGSAKMLPKYLWCKDFYDSYTNDAAWYYSQSQDYGHCSAMRNGNFLYRNLDWKFNDAADFIVRMFAGEGRFASVGVANCGTNLTEAIITSGKPSRYYKCLPGRTVDGINENGVCAEVNVVDGNPQTSGWHTTGNLHPLAAVRWILDHATNAQHGAEYIASHIAFPTCWEQNFHYMIADENATYIVENGTAYPVPSASSPTGALPALTNFRLYGDPKDTTGEGQERYIALTNGANITSQWWTLTYTQTGYRASDLPGITGEPLTQLFDYWSSKPREAHRGEFFRSSTSTSDFDLTWWQTVHTSVYDITNRTLRIAVQETDDWYTFAVPSAGGVKPEAVREIVEPMIGDATNDLSRTLNDSISNKRDKADRAVYQVTQTENTDWTWTSEPNDDTINALLVGKKTTTDETRCWHWPVFQLPEGYYILQPIVCGIDPDATVVSGFSLRRESDGAEVVFTATRPRYMDESLAQKQNQQLAAVATGDAQTPADGDLVKYDAANDRLVKATAGTDYADEAVGTSRQVVRGNRFETSTGERWNITVAKAHNAENADDVTSVVWGKVHNTPTTLAGYGITNGATKTELTGYLPLTYDHELHPDPLVRWNGERLVVDYLDVNFGISVAAPVIATSFEPYCWENYHANDEQLPAYLNSLAWRTTGNRTLAQYGITDAAPLSMISPTNTTFSNAVLAVGLNIDTNSVAVLNEIAATFGDFPITGTATTVGGLLAALAAAMAWLKKRTAHLDKSGFGDDKFAGELLGMSDAISAVKNIVNGMFDNGDTTAYPRTTEEG